MSILLCSEVEERFSTYLDGSLSGAQMAEMHEHMEHCPQCSASFAAWKTTVQALTLLAPVKAPREMNLRLRLALSRERARTPRAALDRLRVKWQNTFAPLAVQLSAGLASAILMIGGVLLLIGTFAAPEPATARDDPSGYATQPKFLYVAAPAGGSIAQLDGSVVVRVFVNEQGRVYDYRVLSGGDTASEHAAVADNMMWSVFEPAHAFGEAIPGSVIMSLTGVSVAG